MSATFSCLTVKDFFILQTMLERRRGLDDAIEPQLERKLKEARVVPTEAVDAGVATLNSRLTFRVDGGAAQTRTLVHQEVRGLVGLSLPLATPLGMALIGLAEGEAATVEGRSGAGLHVVLDKVLYQPEAARRAKMTFTDRSARQRPALVLVHGAAGDGWPPLGGPDKIRHRESDDDDGPSAA